MRSSWAFSATSRPRGALPFRTSDTGALPRVPFHGILMAIIGTHGEEPRMLRRKAAAALAALLALALVKGASAGDPANGRTDNRVSVTARGQATAKADAVEI